MKFLKTLLALLLIPLLFVSCEMTFNGDKIKVKGVTLEHTRTITLTDNNVYDTFTVKAYSGNISIEGGSAYDLAVKIWEKYENDVSLALHDGRLVGETLSGKPFAIASIEGIIPIKTSLDIETGAGNIMIQNMEGKKFEVDSGAGNLNFTHCIYPQIEFSTGAGNIRVADIQANNVEMNTGAGNILIKSLTSDRLDCNTGVGNIDVFNSEAQIAECNSGIGNISVSESRFNRHDFNTGIGKVNYKNTGSSFDL